MLSARLTELLLSLKKSHSLSRERPTERRPKEIERKRRLRRLRELPKQERKNNGKKRLQPHKNYINRQTSLSEKPQTKLYQNQQKGVVL